MSLKGISLRLKVPTLRSIINEDRGVGSQANSLCQLSLFFFLFQLFLVQNQFNDDVIINKIAKTQDLVHEICNRGIIFQNHMPTHHIFSLKIHGSLKIYIYFQFRISLKLQKVSMLFSGIQLLFLSRNFSFYCCCIVSLSNLYSVSYDHFQISGVVKKVRMHK